MDMAAALYRANMRDLFNNEESEQKNSCDLCITQFDS